MAWSWSLVALVLAMVSPSLEYIWERKDSFERNYYDRYQKIPPRIETARKFMENFLDRDIKELDDGAKNIRRRSVGDNIFYDVVFVLDSSASVGVKDYKNGILALQTLITRAKEDTRYAGITFSTEANITFYFTDPLDAMKGLGGITYAPGMTNTQAALDICRTQLWLNKKSGFRRLSFKRILIVTDGQSNINMERTLYNAFQLKNMGIEIFVVAVGKYLRGIAEIVGLASSTDAHLYRVRNLRGLLEVVHLIPPWRLIHQQQRTWLANMFENVEDEFKYFSHAKQRHNTH
ncbi:uncharacterized protein LOC5520805 [Nematostella vectensis]|uniref:uncharacterized protein LOC5520805 n=1 Tax=Nematostella vectensis TaxID=45351 RepID=UPI0013904D5C|nr:uncharacterized protein LOC5520805 [Nematostella vectensis]